MSAYRRRNGPSSSPGAANSCPPQRKESLIKMAVLHIIGGSGHAICRRSRTNERRWLEARGAKHPRLLISEIDRKRRF